MSYQNYLIPELFHDSYLFSLEQSSKHPLRLVLLSLACCADRAGRFRRLLERDHEITLSESSVLLVLF